jgi:hypothetical protein
MRGGQSRGVRRRSLRRLAMKIHGCLLSGRSLLAGTAMSSSENGLLSGASFLWAWLAIAYHLVFFTRINSLAYVFSGVSLVGGLTFLWQGVVRRRLEFAWVGGGRASVGDRGWHSSPPRRESTGRRPDRRGKTTVDESMIAGAWPPRRRSPIPPEWTDRMPGSQCETWR